MAWQGLSYVLGKLVVLLVTALLARMLAPDDFGLLALALVVISYADVVSDLGVAQALIYLPQRAATVRAALAVALVFGLLLTAAGWELAPALAGFFGRADVTPLCRVLCLALPLGALASVPEALLRRDLRFRRFGIAALVRAASNGVASVALAAAGLGVWALAWGLVIGYFVHCVLAWALAGTAPDLRLWRVGWADLGPIMRFGAPAAAGMLLAKVIFDLDYLIVGRALGASALGYYTMAFRLPELAIINVFFVVSSVTFPLYSRARRNRERLQRGYLMSVRAQSLYGVCAGVGLAVLAPAAVPVLLGAGWESSVAPFTALSVYAAVRSLSAGANDVYKAIGRPQLTVWVGAVRVVLLAPALLVATRWGITGVAWTQAAVAGVFAVLMQVLVLRVLAVSWRAWARAVVPGLAAGAAVGMVAAGVVAVNGWPAPVRLAVGVAAGGLAAAAVVRLVTPGFAAELRGMVRRRAALAR
jgi:PST family polysaccharide transporter